MKYINLTNKKLLSEKSIKDHCYQIETRGYSIVENFLTSEEVEILKNSNSLFIAKVLFHDFP